MTQPKVFFVLLRRPDLANPNEGRDDPFYEFGNFGSTGCHSNNLFHPRHAEELRGARLAFVQGGAEGSRLVYLTPPVEVEECNGHCEARWQPGEMPFKYSRAPILAMNGEHGHFPLVEHFARQTAWGEKTQSGLASKFRTRSRPLPEPLAKEVIEVYEMLRGAATPSDIAQTYNQALPYDPPRVDATREAREGRYRSRRGGLTRDTSGTVSRCGPRRCPRDKTRSPTSRKCTCRNRG